MRLRLPLALVVAMIVAAASSALAQTTTRPTTTDAQIKQAIVANAIAGYSGSCPCPYNTDRAGRSCGRRSAYSRPGGASPVCYEADVTASMVAAFRASQPVAVTNPAAVAPSPVTAAPTPPATKDARRTGHAAATSARRPAGRRRRM